MRVVIIGIGSDEYGDDAAGLVVARLLQRINLSVEIYTSSGDPAQLIGLWDGADAAIVVDAAVWETAPGTVHRMDGAESVSAMDWSPRASTHAMGLPEAIELSRALGMLPRALVVYAIRAGTVAPNAPMSRSVREACRRAARDIAQEVAALAC